jgi:hypothetical protein
MAAKYRHLSVKLQSSETSLAREQAAAFEEDRALKFERKRERRTWLMPVFRN